MLLVSLLLKPGCSSRSAPSSLCLPRNKQCPQALHSGCRLLNFGCGIAHIGVPASLQRGHASQLLWLFPWPVWVCCLVRGASIVTMLWYLLLVAFVVVCASGCASLGLFRVGLMYRLWLVFPSWPGRWVIWDRRVVSYQSARLMDVCEMQCDFQVCVPAGAVCSIVYSCIWGALLGRFCFLFGSPSVVATFVHESGELNSSHCVSSFLIFLTCSAVMPSSSGMLLSHSQSQSLLLSLSA